MDPKFWPAAYQFGQDSDPKTGGAFGGGQEVFLRPGGAGNVQMRPGDRVRNKLFEKDAADYGPCRAIAHVFEVGDITFDISK